MKKSREEKSLGPNKMQIKGQNFHFSRASAAISAGNFDFILAETAETIAVYLPLPPPL